MISVFVIISWSSCCCGLCLFALLLKVINCSIRSSFFIGKSKVLLLLLYCLAHGASEDVFVLLLREVDVIIPVRVAVLYGVVPVILPHGVTSKFATLSILPGLQLQVTHRASSVVVRYRHGTLVGLVIDDLCSEVPLLLLLESFEDVVGAHLHHSQLVIEARVRVAL